MKRKKPFKCSLCPYKCGLKDSLYRHIATVHEKKKPLKGEKKVRDEKWKAIDDKLMDPNASERV